MKCCLIGEKLGHSYSKIIHEEFGFYSYDLVELKENQLGQFVKSGEYEAFNVTIPYKQAIMEYLDYVDPIARQIGAVNTVYRKNGKWCGTNTDYFGMLFMLKRGGITVNGKNVLILGSGGTAKTAISVCKSLSAKTVSMVSRTGEINYNNCYDLVETEVIINTTPVGMFPEINETPIDLSKFARIEAVVDVIYNPINTKLLQDAEK